MVLTSATLQEGSILLKLSCRTNLFATEEIDEEFSAFRVLLADSGFHLDAPLNIYLTRDAVYSHEGKHRLDEVTIDDLLETHENDKKSKNDAYRQIYPWQSISGKLLRYTTGDESCYTPMLEKSTTNGKQGQHFPLNLDLLIVVERSTSMADVRRQLDEQLTEQLDLLESSSLTDIKNKSSKTFRHYFVKAMNQIVTFADGEDHQVRKELKAQYAQLAMDQPFISIDVCDGSFTSLMSSGRLFDVHKNLPSKVKGGEQTLVDGHYAYYHYMQDKFDDNMWGCAYRSLQTLCSWFILQGYTTKPVPTHAQIQQCLIDIEDKPKKFLNSHQWIGSMEVSFVLQNYLNVDCKIVRVERGIDMSEQVRTLIAHFNREGSPIMIGGGVLAHTILGVDFNESTGDSMLLVLDPHYTGVDDIKVIQDKGWVAWKPWSFWSQNAFYNLCCPLRPKLATS